MNYREMIRYGLKSAGGLAANLVLLTVLVDGIGVPPEIAALVSIAVLSVVGYLVMDRWVYAAGDSASGAGHVWRWLKLRAVMLSGKGLNYVLYLALLGVEIRGVAVPYQVAWIIGAGVVFAWTFVGTRYLWHGGVTA